MRALRITFCIFVVVLAVYADGPFCTQSGLGPADMMMSNGEMNPRYMWEKSGGTVKVPVVLDHSYSHKERSVIFAGLAEVASKTCVKFYVFKHPEEVHDGDYVYITKSKGRGCWSYVGKQGGHQDLSLPVGCINHRTVMHEMMHALGFSHEHVRADRDRYVRILWENIQRGRERNFEKKHDSKSDQYGPYDYSSIMHYDNKAFSKSGHDTIRPTRGFAVIGRGQHMSHWDATKINRLYKCGKSGGGGGGGGYGLGSFGGFGFSNEAPDETPDFGPPQSFRQTNPFLSGPQAPRGRPLPLPHSNEVDIDGPDTDYPQFGNVPFYMDHHPDGESGDDYYHDHDHL